MSVFTKQAFTMSAMPTPANSTPNSTVPSRRPSFANFSGASGSGASGAMTPATDPHIARINIASVLFDMDGTLINSSPAVVKAWELFAQTYPLDLDDILHSAHGMRTIDVLKRWCGISDPETLQKEVIRFESKILESAEDMAKETGKSGIEVLPGVAKLLDSLSEEKESRGGEEKWAICTSCKSISPSVNGSGADPQPHSSMLVKPSPLPASLPPKSSSLPTLSPAVNPSLIPTCSVPRAAMPPPSNPLSSKTHLLVSELVRPLVVSS